MRKLQLVILQAAVVVSVLFTGQLNAQQTAAYTEPVRLYNDGLELFNHKKFGAAQKAFDEFIKQSPTKTLLVADAEFYAALCALELQNPDGEYRLLTYLDRYPGNNRQNQAYFELGKYYFGTKNYKKAIPYFEKVETGPLTEAQRDEYHYKLGYSYFTREDYSKALNHLEPLSKKEGIYANTALYYVSHINYSKKNLQTALTGFLKLQSDPNFKTVAPYYISQIYYLQGKYDEVLKYSPALLDSANPKRAPEIARIVGEAYYRTEKYAEAIPYLEKYRDKSGKADRVDHYQLGYAYYRDSKFEKAVEEFKDATGEDSLGQNAHYHLGASYLKLNNKKLAREEFGAASRTSFDPVIEEDALFNFAKLSYELAQNPYGEAIEAFETYINKYPKSERKDEAYTYLVNVYLSTKNYKNALISLDRIKVKDFKLKEAYQKIAFFRGVELFNDKDYTQAIEYFNKSAENNFNKQYYALAKYWKAEANYRLGKYQAAVIGFEEFQESAGAASLPEFNKANYHIGYCNFKLEKYALAATAFRKYVASAPASENKIAGDALIRTGDCYFMNREYALAAEFYGKGADKFPGGSDYAMFQRAIVQGLAGNYKGKIETLTKLIKQYPKSAYVDDAKFEAGQAAEFINDNKGAMEFYESVIKDHPNSEPAKNAKLKIALLHYSNNDDAQALKLFKEIIEKYPGTEISQTALQHVKDIAIENGQIDIYEDLVGKLPQGAASAELDSASYEAAYRAYSKAEYEKAAKGFDGYISKYPNGVFILQAQYYAGESEYEQKNYVEALPHYNYVILKPVSRYTEQSLIKAAYINYTKSNFADALSNYEQLETLTEKPEWVLDAQAGQMRCHVKLKNYQQAIDVANKITKADKVSPTLMIEAQITIGRAAMATGDYTTAEAEFKRILKTGKSALSAEAKYNIAYLAYLKKDHKAVEKEVTALSNEYSSYEYWVAKGFIVWADDYYDQGNLYQAKLTLQSILDNYSGKDEVRDEAQVKLNKIIAEEGKPKKVSGTEENPDEEIELQEN